MSEIRIFFTALMFYTRIPVPAFTGYSNDNLTKATRYFPLIGTIVGGVGAICVWGCSQLLPMPATVVVSLMAMVILTGAFHEDALSDFCDGFGGGYSKAHIIKIMKDSRIGTYGAVSLILLFLLKFVLLNSFSLQILIKVLIAAHAFSRLNPVILIFSANYVNDTPNGKAKPVGRKSTKTTLIIALLFGLLPLILLPLKLVPFIISGQVMVFILFRRYVIHKIGGYTGDVLGALQQLSEVTCYVITCIYLDNS